jgi:hypothetical protein
MPAMGAGGSHMGMQQAMGGRVATPGAGTPIMQPMGHIPSTPYPQAQSNHAVEHVQQLQYPQAQPHMYPGGGPPTEVQAATKGSSKWIWWIVVLLALGAGAGAVLALVMQR